MSPAWSPRETKIRERSVYLSVETRQPNASDVEIFGADPLWDYIVDAILEPAE